MQRPPSLSGRGPPFASRQPAATMTLSMEPTLPPSLPTDGSLRFLRAASDLVAGDTNDATDVFVQNVATGVTHLVSIRSNDGQGSRASLDSALSSNGRYVAFTSYAGDLVRGDTNHSTDIFVHDRRSGKTNRVSVRSDGQEVRGDSMFASISGDGERVAFVSWATQLVRHDTNDFADVFVHNLLTGTTRLASISTDGEQGSSYSLHPSISSDGRFVAFYTASSNLTSRPTDGHTNVYVRNIDQGTTHLVSLGNHEQIGVREALRHRSSQPMAVLCSSTPTHATSLKETPTAPTTSSFATARRRRPCAFQSRLRELKATTTASAEAYPRWVANSVRISGVKLACRRRTRYGGRLPAEHQDRDHPLGQRGYE